MRARLATLVVGTAAALHAREALAGMPTPTLTDWAQVRVETLSFFIVVLLVCAAVVRWLWNGLAKDFPAMPRLSYGKTLAMVVLVGLCLGVVLTMIAGARELLTPGAWRQQGLLYTLPAQPSPPEQAKPADPKLLDQRRERLENLKKALWHYADRHQGRLPESDASPEIETPLWELPGVEGMRYIYMPGLKIDQSLQASEKATALQKGTVPFSSNENRDSPQLVHSPAPRVLAFEPDVFGGDRLVLRTNGTIDALSTAELRRQLSEKPR